MYIKSSYMAIISLSLFLYIYQTLCLFILVIYSCIEFLAK